MKTYTIKTDVIDSAYVNDAVNAPRETLQDLLNLVVSVSETADAIPTDLTALHTIVTEFVDGHDDRVMAVIREFVKRVLTDDLRVLLAGDAIEVEEKAESPEEVIKTYLQGKAINCSDEDFISHALELRDAYGERICENDVKSYVMEDLMDDIDGDNVKDYLEDMEGWELHEMYNLGSFLNRTMDAEDAFNLGRAVENEGSFNLSDDYFTYDSQIEELVSYEEESLIDDYGVECKEWMLDEGYADDDVTAVYADRDELVEAVKLIAGLADGNDD